MKQQKSLKRVLLEPGPSDIDVKCWKPQLVRLLVIWARNSWTLTGSGSMETCVANLIEPGDPMLVCINGVFGMRMADVATRYDTDVTTLEIEWGKVFEPDQIKQTLEKKPVNVVGIVPAETSTGAQGCSILTKVCPKNSKY